MDPKNGHGASGVFKKDNMKLTVYSKLRCCLISIIKMIDNDYNKM